MHWRKCSLLGDVPSEILLQDNATAERNVIEDDREQQLEVGVEATGLDGLNNQVATIA